MRWIALFNSSPTSGMIGDCWIARALGLRAKEEIARSRERQAYRNGGADLSVIDVTALPPLLAALETAFRETGSERLPTRVILEYLSHADPEAWHGWTPMDLSRELRELGMPGAQQLGALVIDGQEYRNPQGYRLDDLRRATPDPRLLHRHQPPDRAARLEGLLPAARAPLAEGRQPRHL